MPSSGRCGLAHSISRLPLASWVSWIDFYAQIVIMQAFRYGEVRLVLVRYAKSGFVVVR